MRVSCLVLVLVSGAAFAPSPSVLTRPKLWRRVTPQLNSADDGDAAQAVADDLVAQAAMLRAEIASLEGKAAPMPSDDGAAAPGSRLHLSTNELEAELKAQPLGSSSEFSLALDSLKASGAVDAWSSAAVGAGVDDDRPTVARVRAQTGIASEDLIGAEELTDGELTVATATVFIGSGAAAIGVSQAGLGDLGAALSWLLAATPIIFLGVGSTAPGVIAGAIGAVRSVLGGSDMDALADRRVQHEAAHLVVGYLVGLPLANYDATGGLGGAPSVEFFDVGGGSGSSLTTGEADRLAAVALAGAVAECNAFGAARGAQGDLATLQACLDRVRPPLDAEAQQAATLRGVLAAHRLLRQSAKPLAAVKAAMLEKRPLTGVIARLETAE